MTHDTIVGRFLGAVGRYSDRTAVHGDDGPMSYAQMAAAAGGAQSLLHNADVRPDDRVGLLTGDGAETVSAILGVLGVGAAYVPLDPTYPRERLLHMVRHADITALLASRADESLARHLVGTSPIRLLWREDARPGELRVAAVRDVDAPAYLLFTSGSTGLPKAVAQSERSLLHCVHNQIASLRITSDDRLSLLASFSFDAAIPDVFPALLSGATVVPIDIRGRGLGHVAAALIERRVTIYHSTPTVYRYLLDALGPGGTLPHIRTVLLGGEPVTRADLRRGLPHFSGDCVFINGYGATEATFIAHGPMTAAEVEAAPDGPLPIGQPLPGYAVVLRDNGEITVRGRHVAPGYWRDHERTAERFAVEDDGTRTYRTGDLGRSLPDGRFQCLGRLDRQLKIRGFRVEPAEIEARLEADHGVARAMVVSRGDDLVGYVQPSGGPLSGGPLDVAELRHGLAAGLPPFMVPNAIVVLAEWPMTPTGKIDVLALPSPYSVTASAPATQAEQAVHDEWCVVLEVEQVGVEDSFFDVGGHSLLLGRLQQRLSVRFGRAVSLVRLIDGPTVRAHAAYLTGSATVGSATAGPATAGRATAGPATVGPATAGPATVGLATDRPNVAASVASAEGVSSEGAERTGEEIAVIGLAGRFPGAPSTDALWWNLCAGVDSIHDYTESELRALGIGSSLLADPAHVRAGGRLSGVEDFDAELFGFSETEAARTDPQHRLFLECAWEALEDAGCDPDRFEGPIGVFASASINRYFLFHLFNNPALGVADPDDWEGRVVPHQLGDHLPGQIAYRLGLTGPAIGVQTACSSSLVAVCQAAQSLLDFRCDVALAGGVSVTWPRYRHTLGGLVSPDGRCRSFDARGEGAGFSSGAGVVALKRLADAEADGDFVYAILPGWAVTNDGAARGGFAVPGVAGQAAAVTEALAGAGVSADEIGLVEAHGSGTPLGDAIEVAALNRAFRAAGARRDGYCALGSVKTNIGHLDAAAGIAGLIKAVLAVHHGRIPASLHFGAPDPELDLPSTPFTVPVKNTDWPVGTRRVAAVSAIGLGGTNAHVIVAEAATREAVARPARPAADRWLLPLSAHTPKALREVAARLGAHLTEHRDLSLDDVAHTLATGRRRLRYRTVVECRDMAGAIEALRPDRLPANVDSWPIATRAYRVRLPSYPFQRSRHWIDAPQIAHPGTHR